LPEIAAKAVVYAGVTRQSRSDGYVAPLGEMKRVLDSFEAGSSP